MECYCHLRNVQDVCVDGQTLHERRFNSPFVGPTIPPGTEVKFNLVSATDQGRVHHFRTKVLPGIIMVERSEMHLKRLNLFMFKERS